MENHPIKNIDFSQVIELAGIVDYAPGQVISRTLSQNKSVSITVFSFDKGEEISSHQSTGDALVYILDGHASITVGEQNFELDAGKTIVMPAGVPHAVMAAEQFKMLLVVVFPSETA